MASVPTTPSFAGTATGTPAAAGSSGPALLPGTAPGTSLLSAGGASADAFLQLFAQMINAGTGPTEELAGMLLESGNEDPLAEAGDADPDDASDEEGALALAALFPGLACLAPATAPAQPHTMSGRTADANTASSVLSGVASDAAAAILDDLADSATLDAGGLAADAPVTATTTTHAAQMHALLATDAASNADAVPDGTLRAPVGMPAWKDELGAQLTWMASKGVEAASLRLSPENMGPLEVRISMRDGEASVWFGAAHADTRSALEQSLPRLRELFAAQGLVLADAGVSRDAPRNAFKPGSFPSQSRNSSDTPTDDSVTALSLSRVGLVDTYV